MESLLVATSKNKLYQELRFELIEDLFECSLKQDEVYRLGEKVD